MLLGLPLAAVIVKAPDQSSTVPQRQQLSHLIGALLGGGGRAAAGGARRDGGLLGGMALAVHLQGLPLVQHALPAVVALLVRRLHALAVDAERRRALEFLAYTTTTPATVGILSILYRCVSFMQAIENGASIAGHGVSFTNNPTHCANIPM